MRKFHVIFLTVLIFVVLLPLYSYRLARPGIQVWDEQYHVPAAQSYLTGDKGAYRNLKNPPLGKEIIALSIRMWGDDFFAYRWPSAVAASLLAALLFLSGTKLTGLRTGGILALALWLTSTLAFLHARLAMLDMMLSLLLFGGLAAFLGALQASQRKNFSRWLYLACGLVALGGAIKVLSFVIFPLFFIGLMAIRSEIPLQKSLPRFFLGAVIASFLVMFASYGILGFHLGELPEQFRLMFRLQSTPHKDFSGLSPWYDWFLWRGNLWFQSELDEQGRRFAALCIQSPVLWGLGTFASLFLLFRGCRGHATDLVLGLAIPVQIVFWMVFKSQTILTYALPMEPILCLNTAYALELVSRKSSKPARFYGVWTGCFALAAGFYFWKMFPEVWGTFYP